MTSFAVIKMFAFFLNGALPAAGSRRNRSERRSSTFYIKIGRKLSRGHPRKTVRLFFRYQKTMSGEQSAAILHTRSLFQYGGGGKGATKFSPDTCLGPARATHLRQIRDKQSYAHKSRVMAIQNMEPGYRQKFFK